MHDLTVAQLADLFRGRLTLGEGACASQGVPATVAIDSREVSSGSLFVGLKGPRFDGADFARDAWSRGAAAVVAARSIEPPPGRWSLEVNDGQAALWQLAESRRAGFGGTVVGITGSVGKTSARQMTDAVLRTSFAGHVSPRNYNNHIGVPLSLLGMRNEHRYAVLELAASGPGEIASLGGLCRPHIGVITCIGDAHLGGFGDASGVLRAKTELLAAIEPGGHAILNGDEPRLRHAARHSAVPVLWFGRGSGCDFTATDVASSDGRLRFRTLGQSFVVPVWGRHYLSSALAAIAVGHVMGISPAVMAEALADYRSPEHRCQVIELRGATIINDTYNASPTSMRAALELLSEVRTPGRRIVVCGDMKELGPRAADLHGKLGEQVVTVCGADRLIACGTHAADVVEGACRAGMPALVAEACDTADAAAARLQPELHPGDAVLVKGSHSVGMERIVMALAEQC